MEYLEELQDTMGKVYWKSSRGITFKESFVNIYVNLNTLLKDDCDGGDKDLPVH